MEEYPTDSPQNCVVPLRREMRGLRAGLPRKRDFVFHTKDGLPLCNNLQRDFDGIFRRAGIPHCSLHDLGRTFVSYLAMAGVGKAILRKLAGYAHMSTALKY